MKGLNKPFVDREGNKFFGKGKWKEVDAGKGMVLCGKQSWSTSAFIQGCMDQGRKGACADF